MRPNVALVASNAPNATLGALDAPNATLGRMSRPRVTRSGEASGRASFLGPGALFLVAAVTGRHAPRLAGYRCDVSPARWSSTTESVPSTRRYPVRSSSVTAAAFDSSVVGQDCSGFATTTHSGRSSGCG